MSRHAAILGLGCRGLRWAETCTASGWQVTGFDPDGRAVSGPNAPKSLRRAETISQAVAKADFIFCCLPDRLELVQMVVQRAQASAPKEAILCIASSSLDIDAIQTGAIRPGQIFRLSDGQSGAVALDTTLRNSPEACRTAELALAELMAHLSLSSDWEDADYSADAESA